MNNPTTVEEIEETHVGDFNRETLTDNEPKLRQYRDTKSAKVRGVDAKQVRAWATYNGYVLGIRGKMRSEIIEAYITAHNG